MQAFPRPATNAPPVNCFYLCWADKTAVWMVQSQVPQSGKPGFHAVVNWPEHRTKITLMADDPGGTPGTSASPPLIPVSYLKSHLQKSIRRSNPYKTIKTASELLKGDLGEFLRRTLIIALEDTLPLDGYAVLTWFMAAHSKGYALTPDQIAWCLGYVYDLAKCPVYEKIPKKLPDLRLTDVPVGPACDLVTSILFREAYGGTPGDKNLCRQAASMWAQRFQTNSFHLTRLTRSPVKSITPATDGLHFNDWYLAAIDFHCCPALIPHVREKFDMFTEEQIKGAIWHCNSALTDKENIGLPTDGPAIQTATPIWLAIKKVVKAYASYTIYKL